MRLIPNFRAIRLEEFHSTEVGKNSPAGYVVAPTDNQFTVAFLSTELAIHEHTMYYWLRESTDAKWSYDNSPFTRATMTIRMLDSKTAEPIFGYRFYGVYPHEVETVNPNQAPDSPFTRNVIFNFDMMSVLPSTKSTSNILDDIYDKYIGGEIAGAVDRGLGDIADSLNV